MGGPAGNDRRSCTERGDGLSVATAFVLDSVIALPPLQPGTNGFRMAGEAFGFR